MPYEAANAPLSPVRIWSAPKPGRRDQQRRLVKRKACVAPATGSTADVIRLLAANAALAISVTSGPFPPGKPEARRTLSSASSSRLGRSQ